MSTAIAIFVKTPSLSPVKTRLAAGIGTKNALKFYYLSLKAVESTVQKTTAIAYWAIGEEEGTSDPLWQNLSPLYTKEGCLGQRQHHIYETLRKEHEKVLLISADSPQITLEILEEAQTKLQHHDFVIGPAQDGGYYLFGGRIPMAQNIWTRVEYSQNTTRAALIENLSSAPATLQTLSDGDTKEDLPDILAEMPNSPTPQQAELRDWIKTTL